jgi:hypothetical protein
LVAGQAQQGEAPMTDAASALRAAAECLDMPLNLTEVNEGIEWAEAAIAALPPDIDPDFVRELVREREWHCLEMIADGLGRRAAVVSQKQISECFEVLKPVKPRRQRKPSARVRGPDDPMSKAEAAAKANCSVKTLSGHIKTGALKYIIIGHGTKRPRKLIAPADLAEFIANQTRKDVPCPSTRARARRTSTSTSSGEVIAFTAQPKPQLGVKRKK